MKIGIASTSAGVGWYEAVGPYYDNPLELMDVIGIGTGWKKDQIDPNTGIQEYSIGSHILIWINHLKKSTRIIITDSGVDTLERIFEDSELQFLIRIHRELKALSFRVTRFDIQLDDNYGMIPFDMLASMDDDERLNWFITPFRTSSLYSSLEGTTIYLGSTKKHHSTKPQRAGQVLVRIYRRKDSPRVRIEIELRRERAIEVATLFAQSGLAMIPGVINSYVRLLSQPIEGRAKYKSSAVDPTWDELTGSAEPIRTPVKKVSDPRDQFQRARDNLFRLRKSIRALYLHPEYGEKAIRAIYMDKSIELDEGTLERINEVRLAYGLTTIDR